MSYHGQNPEEDRPSEPDHSRTQATESSKPKRLFRIVDMTVEHEGRGISILLGRRENPTSEDAPEKPKVDD